MRAGGKVTPPALTQQRTSDMRQLGTSAGAALPNWQMSSAYHYHHDCCATDIWINLVLGLPALHGPSHLDKGYTLSQ